MFRKNTVFIDYYYTLFPVTSGRGYSSTQTHRWVLQTAQSPVYYAA